MQQKSQHSTRVSTTMFHVPHLGEVRLLTGTPAMKCYQNSVLNTQTIANENYYLVNKIHNYELTNKLHFKTKPSAHHLC